jgi:hypothetical protein
LNIFAGSFFSYHHLPVFEIGMGFSDRLLQDHNFVWLQINSVLISFTPEHPAIEQIHKNIFISRGGRYCGHDGFFIVTVIHDDNDHFISKRSAVGDHVFFVV